MLVCGPITHETEQRTFALEVSGYLNKAALPWWEEAKKQEWVDVALESLYLGRNPPRHLRELLDEGCRRVAKRWPYIAWTGGPPLALLARRIPGFWPRRRILARDTIKGVIVRVPLGLLDLPQMLPDPERHQKYWLAFGEKHYKLVAMSGKTLWIMPGERLNMIVGKAKKVKMLTT